nr:CHAT domain-containing protein [Imhoffiella purpurea]
MAAQFIRMGVRAVVAAGWAVDDQAAPTFAETFYHLMTNGSRFGEAVRRARERTWQDHRTHNTKRAADYVRESPGASADAIKLELSLLMRLRHYALTGSETETHIAELKGIITRGASYRQLSSLLDYADLLRILCEGASHKTSSFHSQTTPLERITDVLEDWLTEQET